MKTILNISIVLCALAFFAACGNRVVAEKEITQSPNIIYILADDLGYGDVGFNGQAKFDTPNIDRLAASGMVFKEHYAGSTVCAPSRSALLTGMHTGHTVIRGNKEIMPEGQYPMPAATYTLAEMLKKGGYKTSVFGKWGLGFPTSSGDPNNQGFDEFFGYNCQRIAHNYFPYHLWQNQEKIMLAGNEGKGQAVYAPDLIHEKALDFISANQNTPFFMFYASPLPHAELLLPERYINPYRQKFLPESKYQGIDDGPLFKVSGYGSQPYPHAAFAAMVHHLDTQVGELLDKLEELGMVENTVVIFTSDNGPHQEGGADPDYFNSNANFKGYKRDLYEGGIHVPMIVRWPAKIKAGTTTDLISAFWDIFPTFADIAQVEIPNDLDGISFFPTLVGQQAQQQKHDYLYWEFHEKGGRQAVRQGKWKAVKYNVLEQPDAPLELYDLSQDEKEQKNVAASYPEVVATMESILKKARTPSDIFTFNQNFKEKNKN